MALGFEQAGFDVLAAVDLDPVHLAAHERNFPLCEPLCVDINELQAAELIDAARRGWARRHPKTPLAGPVDCVFGGPSCQGFSVIGPRDAADPRNGLVAQFARVVSDLRPRWFVMENVPGLVSPRYRSALEAFYSALHRAGYDVSEPWILNAGDHAVPQERKRVFVVGARGDEQLPTAPLIAPAKLTVQEALGDLPQLSRFRGLYADDHLDLSDDQVTQMLKRQSRYVRRLNEAQADRANLADARAWIVSRLTSVGLTAHSDAVIERFRRLRPGERDTVGRLPKLDRRGLSPTLRAGTGRDHGSFTSARPVHYSSPRVITVREAARLHGFPDWFQFHVTKWHGFRQVGNSVPPPLARAVAQRIVFAAEAVPTRRTSAPIAPGSDDLLRMPMAEAAARYALETSKLPKNVRALAARETKAA